MAPNNCARAACHVPLERLARATRRRRPAGQRACRGSACQLGARAREVAGHTPRDCGGKWRVADTAREVPTPTAGRGVLAHGARRAAAAPRRCPQGRPATSGARRRCSQRRALVPHQRLADNYHAWVVRLGGRVEAARRRGGARRGGGGGGGRCCAHAVVGVQRARCVASD